MTTPTTPSQIARETLKTLAEHKLAPTPENYAQVYAEIRGTPQVDTPNPAQDIAPTPATAPLAWPTLVRDLLKQLEVPHKGITITRKKEGLDTLLSKSAAAPDAAYGKLQALLKSWASAPPSSGPEVLLTPVADTTSGVVAPPLTANAPGARVYAEMANQMREMLAQTLESWVSAEPAMASEIQSLAQQARTIGDHDQTTRLAKDLRKFWIKLELHGGDKLKTQEGLVRLLRLLVENVGELTTDDRWLHGQIATLQEIIAQPLDKRSIADAERNLRNAIIKQGFLKDSLIDAKTTLKSLMSTFIDRLGTLTETTGEYHSKIESYSQHIGAANNLAELSSILDEIMRDTRLIQDSAQKSHQELADTRKQAQEAEERIKQLEQELEQASEKMHADQLTGALNRRGMDETLDREINRADRQQTPVSLALLDIDNFKKLNDTLGHKAGDQALIHLTSVIKETLRPTDAVARYGGEEFIIIMSETTLEEAMATITRLQRELTKRFFLHENQKLLITFSAGVALRAQGESAEDVIERADKAMYAAKKSGKNRALSAE